MSRSRVLFLADVARRIGVHPWRVDYAIRAGHVPEVQIARGRRVFTSPDVRALRRYFGQKAQHVQPVWDSMRACPNRNGEGSAGRDPRH